MTSSIDTGHPRQRSFLHWRRHIAVAPLASRKMASPTGEALSHRPLPALSGGMDGKATHPQSRTIDWPQHLDVKRSTARPVGGWRSGNENCLK